MSKKADMRYIADLAERAAIGHQNYTDLATLQSKYSNLQSDYENLQRWYLDKVLAEFEYMIRADLKAGRNRDEMKRELVRSLPLESLFWKRFEFHQIHSAIVRAIDWAEEAIAEEAEVAADA